MYAIRSYYVRDQDELRLCIAHAVLVVDALLMEPEVLLVDRKPRGMDGFTRVVARSA